MGTAIVVIHVAQGSSVDRAEQTNHQPGSRGYHFEGDWALSSGKLSGGGAPVPGVPRNNLRPSGNVTLRAFARKE